MSKKQTRRSVSLNRVFYDRLKEHCAANGLSMSQFVEAATSEAIDNDRKLAMARAAG